ncbi:SUKH-3 domain-containing protein [Streptomyces halobius]|uniref:SUKH-3 domain-containing protein n=1 Tax=Streptomyces halobius TaxID=2879846 RepID=A0ABY4M5U0_9ACTN|nr:SUKH-3 domain-containing protein [Streptomyces halobius]UQA92204.1 SUKH-3 domain-containing protein [Streptomyces halobius]
MNDNPERPAIQKLRDALSGAANFEVHPLDIEEACRRYAEDGYEVTPQLREFLENYGELTVTWRFRDSEVEVTTSVERTLEATHATPRNARIFAKRLGEPVLVVGPAFETEECVLLAESGDILLAGDAGFQRVANGFGNAIRALIASDLDKTFF